MQRIFLSDLHLDDPKGSVFGGFAACLKTESKRVDEIYILGDLVEMWIGDDDDSPIAIALSKLLQATAKHCPIFLMHGNRDFLFASPPPHVPSPKEGHKYPVFSVTPQVEAGNIFWDGDGSFGVEETPDMA